MSKQTLKSIKAKKQISEYTSQRMYAGMQEGFQMYNIVRKTNSEVVGVGTMKQFIRQFHPLTSYRLEPVG
jgi:hypothetical protein